MTVFKYTEVRAGLDKIGAQKDRPRRHITFRVYDESGMFLGETYMSHGKDDVDDYLLGQMARELKITLSLFKKIIGCSRGRLEYIDMARS